MKPKILLILILYSMTSITPWSLAQNSAGKTGARQDKGPSGNLTLIVASFLEDYARHLLGPAWENRNNMNLKVVSAAPSQAYSLFEKSNADLAMGLSPLPGKKSSPKMQILKNPSQPDILSIQIGAAGALILTNSANPLKGITIPQIDAIFSSSRICGYPFELTKWGQLGLSGPWTDQPIHLTGLTGTTFTSLMLRETALCGGMFKKTLKEQMDSSDVASAVSRDKRAIGFSDVTDTGQKVSAIAVAMREGADYFPPEDKNILSGDYPLSMSIYIFMKLFANQTVSERQKQFIKTFLGKKGQKMLRDYGMVAVYPWGYKKDFRKLLTEIQKRRKKAKKTAGDPAFRP